MLNKDEKITKPMDIRKINGYIHTQEEAYLIIHAIRLGLILPSQKRLLIEERDDIRSGSIFCFIETKDGMKRWTDGKIWSPSKILGHFLMYWEVPRELSKSSLKKEKRCDDRQRMFYEHLKRKDEEKNKEFTLHKKTISLIVDNRSYHVISYFQPFFDRRSIINFPFFKELQVSLNVHRVLTKDYFIESSRMNKVDIFSRYRLPLPFPDNFLYRIDREDLEKTAINVLKNNLLLQDKELE